MELTIALAITILNSVIGVSSFVLNRKDKAVQDSKENNQALINYRLDKIDESLQKINDKLDKYDTEVNEKIDKAIQNHIAIYHKRNKKGE